MKELMQRGFSLFLALMLLISAGGCAASPSSPSPSPQVSDEPAASTEVQDDFDALMLEITRQLLVSDGMTLHFNLVDPEAFGIEVSEGMMTLGEISRQQDEEDLQQAQTWLDELFGFDIGQLSASQQMDYTLLQRSLQQTLDSAQDWQFQFLFEPAQGLIAALNQNFLEFRLQTAQDVEDYLTLLADVPRYLDEALAYTALQAESGIFMQDATLDSAIEEIRDFTAKTEDNTLILNFDEKLNEIDELSEDQRQQFGQRNRQIMLQQILPAYEEVAQTLQSYQGTAQTEGGMAAYGPAGEAAYQRLMQSQSGTDMTIPELAAALEEELIAVLQRVFVLMQQDPQLADKYEELSFPQGSIEEILQLHEQNMTQVVPQIESVTYTVDVLDPSVVDENTLAYYLVPPMDVPTDNVIKVNEQTMNGNQETMFTTLAHEGFPGHLYQHNYYAATHPSPIRSVLSEIAYSEGWAKMMELESYRWAGTEDQRLIEFCQLNAIYGYYLSCLADVAVNGLGWSLSELEEYLANYGADSAAADVYQQCVDNPGVLLPYGVGYLQMNRLREKAQEALGSSLDMKEFYTVILDNGARPFDLVEQDVDAWIEQAQNK